MNLYRNNMLSGKREMPGGIGKSEIYQKEAERAAVLGDDTDFFGL